MSTTSPAPPAPATAGAAPDDRSVLERASVAVAARRAVEVEILESVLAWAHEHMVAEDTDLSRVAGWRSETIHAPGSVGALFGDRAVPIAGVGAPLVAEFAVTELAAALSTSYEAALCVVGDVLDLAHRLPRLWGLVRGLRVPAPLAREAARVSRDLDVDAAAHADRLLCWQPHRLNPHRIGVLVHEARLYADPDRAIADHDEALARRRVEVHHEEGAPGVSEVFMSLDTDDALAFDHTVSTMAATMRSLGHQGELGVRRAHAVGLLADPQQALDLLAAADSPDTPDRVVDPEHDPVVCVAEDAAYAPADPFRHPTTGSGGRHRSGELVLMVHVTDRDLLEIEQGVGRSRQLGPVLTGRLRSWALSAGKVTITPVIHLDPAAHPPVDAHDPPARMAAMVRLRDTTCVFPRCRRSSDRADLDHIDPYVPPDEGGPPGQTHPGNLAPLCRRHHRAKTFGHVTYRRRSDGAYEWTLPSGRVMVTDPPTPRPTPRRRP